MRVRGNERVADLQADLARAAHAERPLFLHDFVECLTAQQLHHEVEPAVRGRAEIEHVDDVRVRHARQQLRLAQEALRGRFVVAEVVADHLDRDRALHRDLHALVDRAHRALRENADHAKSAIEHAPDHRVADQRARDQRAVVVGAAIAERRKRRAAHGAILRLAVEEVVARVVVVACRRVHGTCW
jgi:hypothetical protein